MIIITEIFNKAKQEIGDARRIEEIKRSKKIKLLGTVIKCKEGEDIHGY